MKHCKIKKNTAIIGGLGLLYGITYQFAFSDIYLLQSSVWRVLGFFMATTDLLILLFPVMITISAIVATIAAFKYFTDQIE